MPYDTRAGYDLTFTLSDSTLCGVMFARDDDDTPYSYTESFPAIQGDETREMPYTWKVFDRGMGWGRDTGANDPNGERGGYAYGINVCSRWLGTVTPGGEVTACTGTMTALGTIRQLIEFDDDIWVIGATGFGRFTDAGSAYSAVGAIATYGGGNDTFVSAAVWNGNLYIGIDCSHGTHGILKVTSAPVVSQSAGGTVHTARYLTTVYWVVDNVGAYRLVGTNTDYSFKYTAATATDPLLDAQWIGTQYVVGDTAHPIKSIVTSDTSIWFIRADGICHVDERGWSRNLTTYWNQNFDTANGTSSAIYGSGIVAVHSFGIDYYQVDGNVQRQPVWIDLAQVEGNTTPVTGRTTAITTDSGWLVASVRIASSDEAYIVYGRPNDAGGRNPFVWHGAEAVLSGIEVRAMIVHGLAGAQPYLWCAGNSSGGTAKVYRVSLPKAASPETEFNIGSVSSTHRFNTAGILYLSDTDWKRPYAKKTPVRDRMLADNLDSSTTIAVALRADGGSYTTIDTMNTTPILNENISESISGYTIGPRLTFTGTNTEPALFRALTIDANLAQSRRATRQYKVALGPAPFAGVDRRDFNTVWSNLVSACEAGDKLVLIDEKGKSYTVSIDDIQPTQITEERQGGEVGWLRQGILTVKILYAND